MPRPPPEERSTNLNRGRGVNSQSPWPLLPPACSPCPGPPINARGAAMNDQSLPERPTSRLDRPLIGGTTRGRLRTRNAANDWSTMGRGGAEGPINDELANDWCFMAVVQGPALPHSHRLVDLDLWPQADWCFIAAWAREGYAFASDWPFMLKHQSASSWGPWLCGVSGWRGSVCVFFVCFLRFPFVFFVALHPLATRMPCVSMVHPFSPPCLSLSLCARARLCNADIHVSALRYVWMHATCVLWCLPLLLPACVLACPIPSPVSLSCRLSLCARARRCNADIDVSSLLEPRARRRLCRVVSPSPPCLCACVSYPLPCLSSLPLPWCARMRHCNADIHVSTLRCSACTPPLASCGVPLSSLLPACAFACPIPPPLSLLSSSFVVCLRVRLCNADVRLSPLQQARARRKCLVVPAFSFSPPCLCACPIPSFCLLPSLFVCTRAPLQRGRPPVLVAAAACTPPPPLASCDLPPFSTSVCFAYSLTHSTKPSAPCPSSLHTPHTHRYNL